MKTEQTKIIIISGGQHHNFEKCTTILTEFLKTKEGCEIGTTQDLNILKKNNIEKFDLCILYTQGGKLTKEQEDGITNFVRSGGKIIGIHSASDSFKENKKYIDMLGSVFIGHGPTHRFDVTIFNKSHYITQRVSDFSIMDELYLLEYQKEVEILATAYWKGKEEPMIYIKKYGKGEICYFGLGHGIEAFSNKIFQKLISRAVDFLVKKTDTKEIRCAVIGYGKSFNMGKAHCNYIKETYGLNLVAVCDTDKSRLIEAKQDFPEINTYSNVSDLIKKEQFDMAVVVTTHNTHAELAIQFLSAGKHTIVEKPMCITVKEADSMIKISEKNKVMLSVFHCRRWDGDFMAIQEAINEGLIGKVFHLDAYCGGYGYPGKWWRSDKKISGGLIYDWGAHFIDWILQFIKDEIDTVYAFSQKRVWHSVTNEDYYFLVIRFESGICATYEHSQISAVGKPRWRILGEKGGILDIGGGIFKLNTHLNGIWSEIELKYKKSNWNSYYYNIADHLLMNEPLIVTPQSARKVIAVIETAQKSAETHRAEKLL